MVRCLPLPPHERLVRCKQFADPVKFRTDPHSSAACAATFKSQVVAPSSAPKVHKYCAIRCRSICGVKKYRRSDRGRPIGYSSRLFSIRYIGMPHFLCLLGALSRIHCQLCLFYFESATGKEDTAGYGPSTYRFETLVAVSTVQRLAQRLDVDTSK